MLSLPENLERAIHDLLKTMPTTQWARAAQKLSRRYRGPRQELPRSFARGEEQVLAYLAQIMPAAYAQLYGAMAAMRALMPKDWQPCRLLDLGSGPGTAIWAAMQFWPSLSWIEAWKRERNFIEIGQLLAVAGEHPAMRQIISMIFAISRSACGRHSNAGRKRRSRHGKIANFPTPPHGALCAGECAAGPMPLT